MTPIGIIVLIAAIVIACVLAWYLLRERRSRRLRSRFGPEYERTLGEYTSRSRAEEALERRERRIERIPIRGLSREEHDRFAREWHDLQSRFVDDPPGSIAEADRLVCEVMRTRGYPVADFERRTEDLSVDHPHVVSNYRAAHAIALRHEKGEASTEDLRQALVHYRDLFDELLEAQVAGPRESRR